MASWYDTLIERYNESKDTSYEDNLKNIAEFMLRNKLPIEILTFDENIKNAITQLMVEKLLKTSN